MPASSNEVREALEHLLEIFKEVPTPAHWKLLSDHCHNLIYYGVADQRTVLDALSQMVVLQRQRAKNNTQ